MRSSLMFKLMGAFLLVIAIGALVISFLTSQATQAAFSLYTTRSGQAWAQQIAPSLADYYASNGNWQGVETVINDQLSPASTTGAGPHMMGNGNGAGQGMGLGLGRQSLMSSGMGALMDPRLILADDQGKVISDSATELLGKTISASDLAKGAQITTGNKSIGTIIVVPNELASSTTPASQFLTSVNSSILTAVIIAGVIALFLGAILFLQITSPLRRLKKAANAIAQGDLSQRVIIQSHDELADLGQSFNRMADSLNQAELSRRHMVADVAHELRTPIAVIQANIEGMQDGVLPFDQDQIGLIHDETMLLSRLVDDLRLLSSAESGELKLEQNKVDPGKLVNGVVERMQPQAARKGIIILSEAAQGLPEVYIDSDRITQVLNNLVSNAMRYTPDSGRITVQVSASDSNNFIQVSVSDTGLGIDPIDLPYIFDRFYRADQSRTRASGGSGLGLAIVKQLVEAHGGEVKAESPAFQPAGSQVYGTRITFTLPVLHLL
jgi:two-component system, OmpR family, sensor kinase